MYEIVNVHEHPAGVEECVKYIHSKWGGADNFSYFYDAVINSIPDEDHIPQFYVMIYCGEIIGCYGLIINDFISRHDIYPWFSSLYIDSSHRGKSLCKKMFDHAEEKVKAMGFSSLYLTTDHDGLYEKFGWEFLSYGYEPSGIKTRIYSKNLL